MSAITDFLIKRSSLQVRGAELAGEMAKRVMSRDAVINFFNKINPALGRRAAETLTEKSYIIPRLGLRTPNFVADNEFRTGLKGTQTIDDYLGTSLTSADRSLALARAMGNKQTWFGRNARHNLATQLAMLRKFNKAYKTNFYDNLLRDLKFTPVTYDMQRAMDAGHVSNDLFTQAALADALRYHNNSSAMMSTVADNLKIPKFVRNWYGRAMQNVNLMPAGSRRAKVGKKVGDWLAEKLPGSENHPVVAAMRGENAFYSPFGDVLVSSMDDVTTQHEQAHKLLANLYDRNPEQVVDRYRKTFGRLRGTEQRHNLTLPWDNYNTMHEGATDFARASLNPLRQDREYVQKITGRTPSVDVSKLRLNDIPVEEALDQMQYNYGSDIAPRRTFKVHAPTI
jgi:hypothetical protein